MPGAGIVLAVAGAFVAAQAQHLAWSTARVTNDAAVALADVVLRVDDAVVALGALGPGASRFVRLPDRGDATFSIGFTAEGVARDACRDYVEGAMYHVVVVVDATLAATCAVELGVTTTRIMLLEML